MITKMFWNIIEIVSISLSVILPLLLVIAFFTLLERKTMASLQRRIGPNIHGYYGALQPLIDGLKLLWKEMLVPAKANFYIFIFSPMFMMSLSFSLWAVLPLSFTFTTFDSKLSLITFFVISSINVYNIILAGWSSNSKYAFLGSVRAMGQMFSYELVLGFVLLFMLLTVGSLRIYDIVVKQYYVGYLFWPLLPFAIIFFISLLMETNRAPFDLAEAESELVAGYNVEYSSIMFAMFFLGEYCNILAMSSIWSLLFWGGFIANYFGVGIFIIKILTLCFLFVFIRSLLPRYRIDQLIYVGWHVMLPVSLGLCVFLAFIASVFNIFPQNSTYFASTIPENLDISTMFYNRKDPTQFNRKDIKWFHNMLIGSIIQEGIHARSGTDKLAYAVAMKQHFGELDFSQYMFSRMDLLDEFCDPKFRKRREDLINRLLSVRYQFDMTRRFSEWLTTEIGRIPYGWTERQYIKFMTDPQSDAFYYINADRPELPTRSVSFARLKGMPLSLEFLDRMYANQRFSLPEILQEHRYFIAPSKYALLSPESQARLDIESPSRKVYDLAKIEWINHFSNALDTKYDKTGSVENFESPFQTESLWGPYIRHEEFARRRARARIADNIMAWKKLNAYSKKFDLSVFFSKETLDKYPFDCMRLLDGWRLSYLAKKAAELKVPGVCPMYAPNDDVTQFGIWGSPAFTEVWDDFNKEKERKARLAKLARKLGKLIKRDNPLIFSKGPESPKF